MVNILLAIFSGVILSGAFAPLSLWWLAPIAIGLHIFCIKRSTRPFLNSFLFALVFNAIALHWTSTFVGAIPWSILAIGQAVLFMPLGFAHKYGIALYPFIFLLLEQIRGSFPFGGFGWMRVAYSQADAPYSSIAAIGGAVGLSALVLCISLTLFALLNARLHLFPLFPLILLLIPIHTESIGTVKVLMVQGDVPALGLDFNSRAKVVFLNHVNETKKALTKDNNVDFILWPENAVDVDPFTNSDVEATLNTFSAPLIIGAVTRQKGDLQNVSILWRNKVKETYVKQHLTPFGEYIPLRSIASKISLLAASVQDFTPGSSSKIFTIGAAKIAPIICFELIDDSILSTAAQASNLIVVQTNSATFGFSPESAQQLEISRIRAIEHGRNTLSVSTTGISAVIDSTGVVTARTQIHEPAHIFATVQLLDSQSPRDRAGHWATVAVFIWLLIVARTGRKVVT